jgi:hypothetical protein
MQLSGFWMEIKHRFYKGFGFGHRLWIDVTSLLKQLRQEKSD